MALFASTYIRTSGATATRNADVLPFPFPARPQAMTGYFRFIEFGTVVDTANRRLFQIGNASDNAPRLRCFEVNGNAYRFDHSNRTGTVTVGVTLATGISIGDTVELVLQLNADGSLVGIQSINSAAETTTPSSAALVLAAAWSAAELRINSRGSSSVGFNAFRNIVFHRGVQSLATMRRLAWVI